MKRTILLCFAVILLLSACRSPGADKNEILDSFESAIGDEYKRQFMTEVIETVEYENQEDGGRIYLYVLRTTFYEKDPEEVTGLHTEALNAVFTVAHMESCEEKTVNDMPAAIYKNDDVAYICWTYTPELSFIIQYDPNTFDDDLAVDMAESVNME